MLLVRVSLCVLCVLAFPVLCKLPCKLPNLFFGMPFVHAMSVCVCVRVCALGLSRTR